MASIIGHGLATRFPKLKFMPVEFASELDPARSTRSSSAPTTSAPVLFDEDPVEVFNRNVWVHIFHEPDPKGLIDLGIPADHLMFGSDFPHPEGMADPLAYSEVVEDLPLEEQALIMGGVAREGDEGRSARLTAERTRMSNERPASASCPPRTAGPARCARTARRSSTTWCRSRCIDAHTRMTEAPTTRTALP